jgi:hypothetical protein
MRAQNIWLALLHRSKVQITEERPSLEIAGEQGIRHLPEEVFVE